MAQLEQMKRVHYYNGQLLDAGLFNLEQDYVTRLSTTHNQTLFTAGIASGLEVSATGGAVFSICQGMALDRSGRQLVWPHDGPPQTVPNHGACTGADRVEVYIAWHEQLLKDPAEEGRCNEVSLLPKILYDGEAGCNPELKIATLTLNNGNIEAVDNSKTRTRLKVAATGDAPEPRTQLAGSADFELEPDPGVPVWRRVYYTRDQQPAFSALPIVTATAVTEERNAWNLTLTAITKASFEVGITWLSGQRGTTCKAARVTVNWTAAPRTAEPYRICEPKEGAT